VRAGRGEARCLGRRENLARTAKGDGCLLTLFFYTAASQKRVFLFVRVLFYSPADQNYFLYLCRTAKIARDLVAFQ
jgi:hypothetical protein